MGYFKVINGIKYDTDKALCICSGEYSYSKPSYEYIGFFCRKKYIGDDNHTIFVSIYKGNEKYFVYEQIKVNDKLKDNLIFSTDRKKVIDAFFDKYYYGHGGISIKMKQLVSEKEAFDEELPYA